MFVIQTHSLMAWKVIPFNRPLKYEIRDIHRPIIIMSWKQIARSAKINPLIILSKKCVQCYHSHNILAISVSYPFYFLFLVWLIRTWALAKSKSNGAGGTSFKLETWTNNFSLRVTGVWQGNNSMDYFWVVIKCVSYEWHSTKCVLNEHTRSGSFDVLTSNPLRKLEVSAQINLIPLYFFQGTSRHLEMLPCREQKWVV